MLGKHTRQRRAGLGRPTPTRLRRLLRLRLRLLRRLRLRLRRLRRLRLRLRRLRRLRRAGAGLQRGRLLLQRERRGAATRRARPPEATNCRHVSASWLGLGFGFGFGFGFG